MSVDRKRDAEWRRALKMWATARVTSKTIADPYFISSDDGIVTPVAGGDLFLRLPNPLSGDTL